MSRTILIVEGHPDSDPARLCRRLADAYAAAAAGAGHRVLRVDVASIGFDWLRSKEEFENERMPEALQPAWDAIVACEHIVFVFPLWLGTMPALLKAFLEQVMRPGYAFHYRDDRSAAPIKVLKGKSARLVVTMGMPALAYRLWFLGHGLAGMRRNILNFAGVGPVRQTLIGTVGTADAAKYARWTGMMAEFGRRGA